MQENLKLVDLVMELSDARVPFSGRNPDIRAMENGKASLLILNKADLADPDRTEAWVSFYREQGLSAFPVDSRSRGIKKQILRMIREACSAKIERDKRRGIRNTHIRVMVAGIPNVGKSTLINSLAGRASAKTGDKPGVTRGQQWIHLGDGIDLLDTPGILWPRFDDPQAGIRLAWIGSVRDEVLRAEELAGHLLSFLCVKYPGALALRYGIEEPGRNQADRGADEEKDMPGLDEEAVSGFLSGIARSRGCLKAGGEPDPEKASALLLDDFRHARLGRITLEEPPQ